MSVATVALTELNIVRLVRAINVTQSVMTELQYVLSGLDVKSLDETKAKLVSVYGHMSWINVLNRASLNPV